MSDVVAPADVGTSSSASPSPVSGAGLTRGPALETVDCRSLLGDDADLLASAALLEEEIRGWRCDASVWRSLLSSTGDAAAGVFPTDLRFSVLLVGLSWTFTHCNSQQPTVVYINHTRRTPRPILSMYCYLHYVDILLINTWMDVWMDISNLSDVHGSVA